jgi:hypothetical protein
MFDHIAFDTPYQTLQLPQPVQLTIKRLDLIHPQISGNKFFKLKYNLLAAQQQGFLKSSLLAVHFPIILQQRLMQLNALAFKVLASFVVKNLRPKT